MAEGAEKSSLIVAEHVTLWTLLATVSLFTAGQIAHAYQLDALGIHGLRQDIAWQDRVFEGGIAVLNMALQPLVQPGLRQLPWVGMLALFILALWRRGKTRGPKRRIALAAFAGAAYLGALIALSITWGREMAEMVQASPHRDRFVFTSDALPRLPDALKGDNDAGKLRFLASTADFLVVLGGDGKTVYRIAVRDVDVQMTAGGSQPAASAP